MASTLNPYLSFQGTARQAMEFYRDTFGGQLDMNTYGEFGDQDAPGADQIMHARLETPDGYIMMGADTPPGMDLPPQGAISVSISGDGDALRGYWEALSGAGEVQMPLEKQMWGDEFGMCTDQFGVPWMVNITAAS